MPEGNWQILLQRQAEKGLRKLPLDMLPRVQEAIDSFTENPRPHGCIKLTGYPNLYRVRVGDWRIIYAIEEEAHQVVIVEISPRGGAYRDL